MLFLPTILSLLLVGQTVSHSFASHGSEERRHCTVVPLGAPKNDVPQIRKAFEECNNGGKVIFPVAQTYRIAEKIKVEIHNVEIDWSGVWLVCVHRC